MFVDLFLWLIVVFAILFTNHAVLFSLFLVPIFLVTRRYGPFAGISLALLSIFFMFVYVFKVGNMMLHLKLLALVSIIYLLFPLAVIYIIEKLKKMKRPREPVEEAPEIAPAPEKEMVCQSMTLDFVRLIAETLENKYVNEAYHHIFNELQETCEFKTIGIIRRDENKMFEIIYDRGLSDLFVHEKQFTDEEIQHLNKILNESKEMVCDFGPLTLEREFEKNLVLKIDDDSLLFWQGTKDIAPQDLITLALALRIINHFFTLKRELETSIKLAETTNILNFELFYRRLTEEIERLRRYNTGFGIMLVEVENFSKIVMIRGYLAAEKLIEEIKKTISLRVRKVDLISNIEQNKYIVLFPNTGVEGLNVVVGRIMDSVRELCREQSGIEDIYLNAAIVYVNDKETNTDNVINILRQVLQISRSQGPNQIEIKVLK